MSGGIKIFLLANNKRNKELSIEYLNNISGIIKQIKSDYDINIKAVPIDAEGLKRLQLDKRNKIKKFPSAIYAGSIYAGKKPINNLLQELAESLRIKKSKYQDEINRHSTQQQYMDIMGNLSDGDDDFAGSEDIKSKIANFDRKRASASFAPAKDNNKSMTSHGDMVNNKMFPEGGRDIDCFNALLQEETPGLTF